MGDRGFVVSGRGEAPRVLHVLTGSTAVGKTEWALRWAEANSAEIVSCDSLLFYRGMDIGTAKPSALERGRVRHHLIDIRDVSEPMNAAVYAPMALAAAQEIEARGRKVLVVGGSGFYLRSFFAPVADGLEVPPEVRERVAARLASEGLPAMVAELGRLNPDGLGALDASNPRRVASALGRCMASGRTLAELSADFARARPTFSGWKVRLARLDRSGPDLDARIANRVESMLGSGLVDEVRRLLEGGLRSNPSATRAIGYRETIDVLEGRAPAAGLAGAIAKDTRALVKKQRTWFRTQLPAHAVHDAARLRDESCLFLG
jgi:tRNA dimethylallyltransferase